MKPRLRLFWIVLVLGAMLVSPQQTMAAPTLVELGVDDFRVTTAQFGTTSGQTLHAELDAIAYNAADDAYLVVSSSNLSTAEGSEIWGRIVDASSGTVDVDNFLISNMGAGNNGGFYAFAPAVTYNPTANEYLVVWEGVSEFEPDLVADEREIFGQRVAADGSLLGANFRISTMGGTGDSSFDAEDPQITYNPDADEYLVVWWGDDDTGLLVNQEYEIFGRRLSGATAAPLGADEVRISNMGEDGTKQGDAFDPQVVYNGTSGEYLVVWWGSGLTSGFEVYGQRLDGTDASEIGTNDFPVSSSTDPSSGHSSHNPPELVHNPAQNEYLVVWYADSGGEAPGSEVTRTIRGQRLGADGTQVGADDFIIEQVTPHLYLPAPSIALTYSAAQNEYLAGWSRVDPVPGTDDLDAEIRVQRLVGLTGEAVGTELTISNGDTLSQSYSVLYPQLGYSATTEEYMAFWVVTSWLGPKSGIYGQRLGFSDNIAPVLEPIPDQNNAAEETGITLQVNATDSDTLTYAADNLPPDLSISPTTGLISGDLTAGSAGSYVVTISVSDDGSPSLTATTSFVWTVAASSGNNPPDLDAIPDQFSRVGDSITGPHVTASDPDSDDLTFSAVNLPDGVSLNPVSGVFTGTVAEGAEGTYLVEVTVLDDGTPALAASVEFTWEIGTFFSPVIYVDADAAPGGNGRSWAAAYRYVQDALYEAAQTTSSDTPVEVWIAEGIYYPDEGIGTSDNDRTQTFNLVGNVALIGGFAGTETSPEQRDIANNPTILSGDIDQNDRLDGTRVEIIEDVNADSLTGIEANAHQVMKALGIDGPAVLDGLVVTAGNANSGVQGLDLGGALFSHSSNVSISKSLFTGNYGEYSGAIEMYGGTFDVTDVTFQGNAAFHHGGGTTVSSSIVTFTRVNHTNNSVSQIGGSGTLSKDSELTVIDSTYEENSSLAAGALMITPGNLEIIGSTFRGNVAANSSAVFVVGNVTISDSTFEGNTAASGRGGAAEFFGLATISNSTFAGNVSETGEGGAISLTSGSLIITGVTFTQNRALYTGGAVSIHGTATISDSTFDANTVSAGGGGAIALRSGGLTASGVNFTQNHALYGGAIFADNAHLRAVSSHFHGNTASNVGGAIDIGYGYGLLIANSTLVGNSAGSGAGGIHVSRQFADFDIINTTFASNQAGFGNGDLFNDDTAIDYITRLSNVILWQGEGFVSNSGPSQIIADHLVTAYFWNLTVEDADSFIVADAGFVKNPSPGPDGDWGTEDDDYGNLQLSDISPAADRGAADLLPADLTDLDMDGDTAEPLPLDVAGSLRQQNATVDIGAYESPHELVKVQPNLLNSSFEDDLNNWDISFSGSLNLVQEHGAAVDGTHVLIMDGTKNNGIEGVFQWVPHAGSAGDVLTVGTHAGGIRLSSKGIMVVRLSLMDAELNVLERCMDIVRVDGSLPTTELSCSLTADTAFEWILVELGARGITSGFYGFDATELTIE